MNTTVQSLQALYVKLGGELTDTYAAIADGAQVGDYTTIPDMIDALSEIAENGGDGGALPADFPAEGAANANKIIGFNANGKYYAFAIPGSPISLSETLTLTSSGWDASSKQQTVSTTLDLTKRNVIDITLGENAAWDSFGVYPIAETANGITFEAAEIPDQNLTFKVCSMEV